MAYGARYVSVKLYSYKVARDYGFAPNPFHGYCTLATCKPKIRSVANVGDWVVGTGAKKYRLEDHIIFAMRVTETCSFNEYWSDPRFQVKRPILNGSLKQVYGDNIYRKKDGNWIQADSHHSCPAGEENLVNLKKDTKTDKVLISDNFVYFGAKAKKIPQCFLSWEKSLCCANRHHHTFDECSVLAFIRWLRGLHSWSLSGLPLEFASHKRATR
ncbi:MAG: hypothetical protein GKR94_23715 [Gammaproteobacteria bacterium]|nr:hypothetical protein [Gammaproteobacteria bacterium]